MDVSDHVVIPGGVGVTRQIIRIGGVLVFVAVAAACGKSAEQQAAEEAAQAAAVAAESAAKSAASSANDMGKALEGFANALAGGNAGATTVEPVTFQSLMAILPEVDGWQREQPRGERMTVPVAFSQAEVVYRKDDARVEVKVVDTGFAQILIAPFSMMMAAGYSRESSEGHEKGVTVDGHPGIEQWRISNNRGELTVAVAKRFLVTVEGSPLADASALRAFTSAMNLGTLANLK
jgi:hypothetical protein